MTHAALAVGRGDCRRRRRTGRPSDGPGRRAMRHGRSAPAATSRRADRRRWPAGRCVVVVPAAGALNAGRAVSVPDDNLTDHQRPMARRSHQMRSVAACAGLIECMESNGCVHTGRVALRCVIVRRLASLMLHTARCRNATHLIRCEQTLGE